MKLLAFLSCLSIAFSAGLQAKEAEPNGIPYNSVNKTMQLLKGRKMDGVECVPFFVRTDKGRPELVPADANFRIITWDGETVKLKCEPLAEVPAGEVPEKWKKEGYTHVLWMPKDVKKYLDGAVHHSLPGGSVLMSQGVALWEGDWTLPDLRPKP